MSTSDDKTKYNEIMKNNEFIEKEKTINLVLSIIAIVYILLYTFIPKVKEFTKSIIGKSIGKIIDIVSNKFPKIWDKIKILFNSENKLTTGMGLITLGIATASLFFLINAIGDFYSPGNSIWLIILLILSIFPAIFFFIRLSNKKGFFNNANSPMPQLFNILNILKSNVKMIVSILTVVLGIGILGMATLSSEKSFIAGANGVMLGFSLIMMVVAYTFIIRTDIFKKIKNFQPLHLLFNLIFIVPCVLSIVFNWTYEQIKNTPSFVYTILLIETIIIALYFIIPHSQRKFYFSLSNKKTNAKDLEDVMKFNKQKKSDLQKKIFKLKEDFFRKSHGDYKYMNEQGVNDTWDELFTLYSDYNDSEPVKNRLRELEFCSKKDKVDTEQCNKMLDGLVEYIRNSQQKINTLDQEVKTIKTELSPEEKFIDDSKSETDEEGNYTMKDIQDSVVLQMKPVSLKKQTVPTSSESINLFTNIANQPNYSYGLSFWVFVHPQSGNIKECNNIINFDNRPQILYCPIYKKIPKGEVVHYKKDGKRIKTIVMKSYSLPNDNVFYNLKEFDEEGTTHSKVHYSKIEYKYPYSVLKFVLGSDEGSQKEFAFPYLKMQKWNNVVVNFIDGTYDLFVNGEMVNSFQGGMEELKFNDINIGEDNGISGGIANIVYYKNYLTKDKIINNYNLLKNKSPPIISSLIK
jgi:hypothetical protein